MHLERATEILRLLADGYDPFTGETLPASSPYQNADTVRALFLALKALESQARKEARKERSPSQAGRAWAPDEEARLVAEFHNGATVPELARSHQRSRGSIVARLNKLGLVEVTSEPSVDSDLLADMAAQGKQLDDIAAYLRMKPDAAAGKLAVLIERRESPLDNLLSPEDRRVLSEAFSSHGGQFLKPIFEHFAGRYDYPTLKLARAWWKREIAPDEPPRPA